MSHSLASVATSARSHRALVSSAVLALIMVMALVAPASASIVVHLNPAGPGHYDWTPPGSGLSTNLNILFPASIQTSLLTDPGSYRQTWTTSEIRIAASGTNRVERLIAPSGTFSLANFVDEGTSIPAPSPAAFSTAGAVHRFGTPIPGDPEYALPEGTAKYLGVRFNLGAGDQYGWIGVVRTGSFVDAFAWGYETEVGVAIAAGAGIPTPGSLALLAIGALAGKRRRRRE